MLAIALVLIIVGAVVWALLRPDLGKALVGIGAVVLLLGVVLGLLDGSSARLD